MTSLCCLKSVSASCAIPPTQMTACTNSQSEQSIIHTDRLFSRSKPLEKCLGLRKGLLTHAQTILYKESEKKVLRYISVWYTFVNPNVYTYIHV